MDTTKKNLNTILRENKNQISDLIDAANNQLVPVDLSVKNQELQSIDINDVKALELYIDGLVAKGNGTIGIGGYNENRSWYARGEQFHGQDEVRSIHLGIDLWTSAGTPLFTPLKGKVHSFKNNNLHGDYGPTIILEHCLEDTTFHTLYGHLSLSSLEGRYIGETLEAGEQFASIGSYPINGDWPPHLHLQLITEIKDAKGDFFGTASESNKEYYLSICPDPTILVLKQSM